MLLISNIYSQFQKRSVLH